VRIVRALTTYGYDDAPHGHAEVHFDNVTVPAENLLLGEGRGFEIAQGRLGPGRLHHCMRVVGMAERAMELMRDRMHRRTAFGGPLSKKEVLQHKLAECRISLEQARLMVLNAAHQLDTHGNKVRHLLGFGAVALHRSAKPGSTLPCTAASR
jgi:alkylation response protein AidB-like acyl-CoA dehydrogenase